MIVSMKREIGRGRLMTTHEITSLLSLSYLRPRRVDVERVIEYVPKVVMLLLLVERRDATSDSVQGQEGSNATRGGEALALRQRGFVSIT